MKSTKKSTKALTREDIEPQNVKERITVFIDEDVLDELRAMASRSGSKYQTLLNHILREAVLSRSENNIEKRLHKVETALALYTGKRSQPQHARRTTRKLAR